MDGFPYVATAVLPSSACGFSHAVTALCAVTALSIRSGCGFPYVVIAVQAENVFITLAVTAVSLSNEHGFSHAVMALSLSNECYFPDFPTAFDLAFRMVSLLC